jgi:hypothetical protein
MDKPFPCGGGGLGVFMSRRRGLGSSLACLRGHRRNAVSRRQIGFRRFVSSGPIISHIGSVKIIFASDPHHRE